MTRNSGSSRKEEKPARGSIMREKGDDRVVTTNPTVQILPSRFKSVITVGSREDEQLGFEHDCSQGSWPSIRVSSGFR